MELNKEKLSPLVITPIHIASGVNTNINNNNENNNEIAQDSISFAQNPLLKNNGNEEAKEKDDSVCKEKGDIKEDKCSDKDFAEEHSNTLLKKRKVCGLIEGCDSIENYFYLNKIHEGVYGIVFRAQDKITNEIYAIKKVKLMKDGKEGFPITSIREINILLSLKHPNIVNLKEVAVGSTLDKIYVVMEYMEHELKDLMDNTKYSFSQAEIKCLMKQLLEGPFFKKFLINS